MTTTTTIASFEMDGSIVAVRRTASGYTVACTDGVASDWTEEYDTLSAALARLALLADCADSHGTRVFADGPVEFAASWQAFASTALS